MTMFKKSKLDKSMECVYAGPDFFSKKNQLAIDPNNSDGMAPSSDYPLNHAESDESTIICSNCGASVPNESKFCPGCGTAVDTEVIMEDVYAGPDML